MIHPRFTPLRRLQSAAARASGVAARLSLWVFLACADGSVFAQPLPGPEPEVVPLETFVVESAIAAPWKYAKIPGFEILSQCDDTFNQRFVRAIQQSEQARLAFLPPGLWGEPGAPVRVILYHQKPQPSSEILQRSPLDLNWSVDTNASSRGRNILFAHATVVTDGDVVISCGNYWDVENAVDDLSVDIDSGVRLDRRVPQLPGWFLAGVKGEFGVYKQHHIEPAGHGTLVIEPTPWISDEKTNALRDAFEKARQQKKRAANPGLLALDQLFANDFSEPTRDLWESECALFVRWALFGRTNADRVSTLAGFVDAAAREPVNEAMFRKFFGIGFEQAQEQLGNYFGNALTQPVRIGLSGGPDAAVEFQEATSSQVARIIGSWLRLEAGVMGPSHFRLQDEYRERAEKLFRREYAKHGHDADFLGEYGLFAAGKGEADAAEEALAYATNHDIERARAYVEVARLHLKSLLTAGKGEIAPADRGDYLHILNVLWRGKRILPGLPSIYEAIAEVRMRSPEPPSLEELADLQEAVHLFPKQPRLAEKMAAVYSNFGYTDKADELLAYPQKFIPPKDAQPWMREYGYK